MYEDKWKRIQNILNHCSIYPFILFQKISVDTLLMKEPSISDGMVKDNIIRPL